MDFLNDVAFTFAGTIIGHVDVARHSVFGGEWEQTLRTTEARYTGVCSMSGTENLEFAWDVEVWGEPVFDQTTLTVNDSCAIVKGESVFKWCYAGI